MFCHWLGRNFKNNIENKVTHPTIEIVFWNASHDRDFDMAFKVKYPVYNFYKSVNGISVFSKSEIKILNETSSIYATTVMNFKTYNLNV